MTESKNPNIVATIVLEDPIHYGLDAITELKIRKPTARDVIRVGNPVKIKSFDPLEIEFDENKSFRMLSSLTSLPVEGTLESMSSNDAVSALYAIAPFFIPGYKTKAADPSMDTSSKPDEQ